MSDLDDEELEATRRINGVKRLTADEMFEELGYYKDFDDMTHEYRKEKDGDLFGIDFFLEDKEVSKNYYRDMGYITMQELKAINKKVKELGWLDE